MKKRVKIFLLFFLFTPCAHAMDGNGIDLTLLREHMAKVFTHKAQRAIDEGRYAEALAYLQFPAVLENSSEAIVEMRGQCEARVALAEEDHDAGEIAPGDDY